MLSDNQTSNSGIRSVSPIVRSQKSSARSLRSQDDQSDPIIHNRRGPRGQRLGEKEKTPNVQVSFKQCYSKRELLGSLST